MSYLNAIGEMSYFCDDMFFSEELVSSQPLRRLSKPRPSKQDKVDAWANESDRYAAAYILMSVVVEMECGRIRLISTHWVRFRDTNPPHVTFVSLKWKPDFRVYI